MELFLCYAAVMSTLAHVPCADRFPQVEPKVAEVRAAVTDAAKRVEYTVAGWTK